MAGYWMQERDDSKNNDEIEEADETPEKWCWSTFSVALGLTAALGTIPAIGAIVVARVL